MGGRHEADGALRIPLSVLGRRREHWPRLVHLESRRGFARYYIEDSIANDIMPAFTCYMMRHSTPGGGDGGDAVLTNVSNTATTTAYDNDLKLLFQKAGAFPTRKGVLHVGPDFWGYAEQRSTNDDAKTISAQVAETDIAELAGLPGNVSGFAQAIVRLRDAFTPNVILAYHVSVWGTRVDIFLQDPPDTQVDLLAGRAAAFYNSLGARFDITCIVDPKNWTVG
jgi:hypothetical protein